MTPLTTPLPGRTPLALLSSGEPLSVGLRPTQSHKVKPYAYSTGLSIPEIEDAGDCMTVRFRYG